MHRESAPADASVAIDTWVNQHAVVMLVATAIAAATRTTAPIAAAAVLSFAMYAYLGRATLMATPPYGGYANRLTALRLGLVIGAALLMRRLPAPTVLLLFTANVALDVADGYVARRRREATHFGAALDREADAVFVLVAYLYFFTVRSTVWVLVPALLPYVFRLVVWTLRDVSAHQHKRRYATVLAGVNYACLLAAVAAQDATQLRILAISAGLVIASFIISFWDLRKHEYSFP